MRILKIATALTLLALSSTAYAQSSAGSQSGASNRNDINVNSYGSNIPDRQTLRTTGNAIVSGAGSPLSCKLVGGAGVGVVGISGALAIPLDDYECDLRQFVVMAGSLYQATGQERYIQAADAALCDSKVGRLAMPSGGTSCPANTRGGKAQAQAARNAPVQVAVAPQYEYLSGPRPQTRKEQAQVGEAGRVYTMNGVRRVSLGDGTYRAIKK